MGRERERDGGRESLKTAVNSYLRAKCLEELPDWWPRQQAKMKERRNFYIMLFSYMWIFSSSFPVPLIIAL